MKPCDNINDLNRNKVSNVFEKLLSFSDIDSEIPMSQYQASVLWSQVELFIESQSYQDHMADPEFAEIFEVLNKMLLEEEERTEEPAENLPPEDDFGNTEYKLKMTGLTMFKVAKRTTQMHYRLIVGFIFPLLFKTNNVID